jgi:hypothetical protein
MSRAALLAAFDETIAAVRRLQAGALRTTQGEGAGELARLLEELEARRDVVAAGQGFDAEWARRTVRWVAGWLPDGELPLLARLGAIVRAAAEAPDAP